MLAQKRTSRLLEISWKKVIWEQLATWVSVLPLTILLYQGYWQLAGPALTLLTHLAIVPRLLKLQCLRQKMFGLCVSLFLTWSCWSGYDYVYGLE